MNNVMVWAEVRAPSKPMLATVALGLLPDSERGAGVVWLLLLLWLLIVALLLSSTTGSSSSFAEEEDAA
jgi:hypothetical protein